MRYLATFSYDGSCFSGFQKQKGLKTVQEVFENALTSLEGKNVQIFASGRTDKGVHANGQCAHFDLSKNIKIYSLKKYLNNLFNGEIYVSSIVPVSDDFHARYNVKRKTYIYYINMGEYNPTMRNYVYQYSNKLDVSLMEEASRCLIGEHDFRSFCTDSSSKDNCIRNIYDISFEVKDNILKITFTGNGFLRKMIRNIVAILIEIGSSKRDVSYLNDVLLFKKRSGNLKCAFSGGLYLEKVNY